MLLEIVIDSFSFIFKSIIQFFVEFILEELIQRSGYLFIRMFYKNIEPNGRLATVSGFIFWAVLIYAGFEIVEFVTVDS